LAPHLQILNVQDCFSLFLKKQHFRFIETLPEVKNNLKKLFDEKKDVTQNF